MCGFLLLIGRAKAISQVCGYLMLENGIYLFGLLLIGSTPLLVEAGILLDLTVAVFVIGIIVDRIQREFDSLGHPQTHGAARMSELALILVPLAGGGGGVRVAGRDRTRPWLLPVRGAVHAALALWLLVGPARAARRARGWRSTRWRARCCRRSRCCSSCARCTRVTYLRVRSERPNRVFVGALLAVLGLMSLALQAQHLGLLWVAIEAATLATVPLLHFNGTARAVRGHLEVPARRRHRASRSRCSARSASATPRCTAAAAATSRSPALVAHGARCSRGRGCWSPWVLLLVGYGTKMGLAPMHTWKPDAYGEAPGIVGAMLAGGMTTVAFVAVLRVRQVVEAAGEGAIDGPHAAGARTVLDVRGRAVPARARATSSGCSRTRASSTWASSRSAAALGRRGPVGGAVPRLDQRPHQGRAVPERGQHAPRRGRSHSDEVSGMARLTPVSARLFVVGMLAVTAFPPFGPFFSELRIVRAALDGGTAPSPPASWAALLFAFFGLTRLVFAIVDGRPRVATRTGRERHRETAGVIAAAAAAAGPVAVARARHPRRAARRVDAAARALRVAP